MRRRRRVACAAALAVLAATLVHDAVTPTAIRHARRDALLVVGACVHAWTNRARLAEPVTVD